MNIWNVGLEILYKYMTATTAFTFDIIQIVFIISQLSFGKTILINLL